MNVNQLIQALQEYNPEAEVKIVSLEGRNVQAFEISKIEAVNDRLFIKLK